MTITEFEDKITQLRNEYFLALQDALNKVRGQISDQDGQSVLTTLHFKGIAFFNLFERSIDEIGLPEYNLNLDTKNRKIEDAIALCDTIISHWMTIRALATKYKTNPPEPSPYAYASIQRLILYFEPSVIGGLISKFETGNLPTQGFASKKVHSGWQVGGKQLSWSQIIVGAILIGAAYFIDFYKGNLGGSQYLLFRLLLCIGIVLLVAAFIEMKLEVHWTILKSLSVKAFGTASLFVLIYFFNPPSPPDPNSIPNTRPDSLNLVNKGNIGGLGNVVDNSIHNTQNIVNHKTQINIDREKNLSEEDKRFIKKQIEKGEAIAHRKFFYYAVSPASGSRSLKAVKQASLFLASLGYKNEFPDGTYPLSNASNKPIQVSFIDSTITVDISF
ncbi:MAG TPA: hypothetical protein VGN00_07625 [Puia sp.]|jgi:hypothetical protein